MASRTPKGEQEILSNKKPQNGSTPEPPPGIMKSSGTISMADILNTDKSNQQNRGEREAVVSFQKVELVEEQPKKGELINLAFLSNHEKKFIQKVIQADLKFRKVILGSLRKSIDEAQQSQTEETPEQSKPGLCTVCGQEITTICSRVFAMKCSDCGRLICDKCAGKQVKGICLDCKKRRILKLQTLDYESILYYGNQAGSNSTPLCAESELIKQSLQADFVSLEPIVPREKEGLLDHPASDPTEPSSVKAVSEQSTLNPDVTENTLKIPHISDPNCGFQLVAQGLTDEGMISSVYSEHCYLGGKISGFIFLGLWYKAEEKRLYVRVEKAGDLPEAADGALNPYVKTYLLPGVHKSNKRKTGVQNDTSKPAWNEIIKYAHLTQEEVKTKTLWVSVWDWNRYGRQQFLGEVHIPLNNRDLTNSKNERFQLLDSKHENKLWDDTEEPDSPEQQAKPRVLVGLNFDPYTPVELARLRSDKKGKLGCLRIKVRQAENLPPMDIDDRTDSFVCCYLLPNRQLGGKKKSKVIENSLNPIWEEEIVYTYVSLEELQAERALELTLWDFDRRGTNQFIGGVKIGPNPLGAVHTFSWMDSMESESNHWEDMIGRPGTWVEAWHTLRPSMDSLRKNIEADRASELIQTETSGNISSSVPRSRSNTTTASKQSMDINISRPKKKHYKISGEVLIGIKFKDGFLYVKIVKAAGLAAVYRNGTSNPYIKAYLLPDRSKESKKKTEIKKKTINPVYNQAFSFRVSEEEIQTRTLWVTVWNHGSIGANLFMGETCISLAGNLRHSVERWFELHDFGEGGMVVTASPFGKTPQKHLERQPALDVKLSDHEKGAQEKQGAGKPPQDVPKIKVEDTPSKEIKVEETPPKDVPVIKVENMPPKDAPKVKVEDIHPPNVPKSKIEDTPPRDISKIKVENKPLKDAPKIKVEDTPPKAAPKIKVEDTPPKAAPKIKVEDTPPKATPKIKVEDTPPKATPKIKVEDTPPKDAPKIKVDKKGK